MALQKQTVPINFAQGLDLKTDPFQVSLGKFLDLQNTVFDKTGRLTKRNGYEMLPTLPDEASTLITTFNGNLTAVGTDLRAYSKGSGSWIDKGTLQPVKLSTLAIQRSSTNQVQADVVVAENGLACAVFTDLIPSGGVNTAVYKFSIVDSTTGQNIVQPVAIPSGTGTITRAPRVFVLGRYFIILFNNLITGTNHLQYVAINYNTPTVIGSPIDITSQVTPSNQLSFDGVVVNNSLYMAWNSTGTNVRYTRIDAALTLYAITALAGESCDVMNLCADTSGGSPIIYATYYKNSTTTMRTAAFNQSLVPVLAPTTVLSTGSVANIAAFATGGVCTILYELNNAYTYDTSIATNIINSKTITQLGVVGTASTIARSVGLSSKAFIIGTKAYVLAAYDSDYQPTYFLIDSNGNVISKLAYSNGGGYNTTGLPNVTVTDNVAQVAYLRKDSVTAVNKTQGVANSVGIYSQTGINLATFTLTTSDIITAEIGANLNITGGFLWSYDGFTPVEQGFHLWPDYVEASAISSGGAMKAQQYFYVAVYEWTDAQGNVHRGAPSIPVSVDASGITITPINFTSTFSSGDTDLTVSSVAGLKVGQVITDTTTPATILAGTYITAINGLVITISEPTTAAGVADTLSTSTIVSATVNIPTLRLTYKVANPVQIVLYRWSTAQQTYYQVTSVLAPTLNDTTIDYITYTDTAADTSILGNNILYTEGGVVENIPPPAVTTISLFKSRLMAISAEDNNLLYYSKQVIQNTPVEMSDLFTIYVAPTTSAQSATGGVKALAPLDDKFILFKRDAIYYLTGTGPNNTGANNDFGDPTFISSTVGCENQQSIVFIPQGLMFQSDKGIWLLGRDLSTTYIGANVEDHTIGNVVLSAINVPGTNQVRFTMNTGKTLMYDYFYGQWGSFTNIPAVSSTIYEELHTYINTFGEAFQESPGKYLDGANPVLISFTTSWLNLAGLQGFERAYYFHLLAQYISPHKLTVQVAYDYNPSPIQSSVITPDNYSPRWGGEQAWGTGQAWGGPGNIEQWRVFLSQQKCQAFQVSIMESFDSTLGQAAGAGFTMSGLDLSVGLKGGSPKLKAARSVG